MADGFTGLSSFDLELIENASVVRTRSEAVSVLRLVRAGTEQLSAFVLQAFQRSTKTSRRKVIASIIFGKVLPRTELFDVPKLASDLEIISRSSAFRVRTLALN